MNEKYETVNANKADKLKQSPPDIEKVSDIEIYLLDPATGERKKRICGRQKRDFPEGYVCLSAAGKDTPHSGVGPCNLHESAIVKHKLSMWKKIREQNPKLAPVIGEALDTIDTIKREELDPIDNEIDALYALLNIQLKGSKTLVECRDENGKLIKDDNGKIILEEKDGILTQDNYENSLETIKALIKAKQAKSQIEKQILINPKTLSIFINQVFDVIKRKTEESVTRDIMQTIVKEVIMPLNLDGNVKGVEAAEKMLDVFGNVKKTEYRDIGNK